MIFCRWLIVLLFYFGILTIAAFLAPIFYLSVRVCSEILAVGWLRYLSRKPLECYVDRLRMAVGCIVVLVALRKSSETIRGWNLRHGFPAYAKTFCFGVLTWIVLFWIIKTFVPALEFKATPTATVLLQAFIAGGLLAIAEEVLFRGFLWDFVRNGSRQSLNGMGSVSLVFALLHFSHCRAGNGSGLFVQSFQCALHSVTDIPQQFCPEFFLCVFLLGLLLSMFRIRTRTLWGAVGFHQGLITTLFVLRKCVRYPEVSTSRFWGTGKLTDAWFVVLVLGALCVWMLVRTKRQLSASAKE